MNLLVKKFKVVAVVLLTPLFFVSCEDPGKIGLDVDPKNSVISTKYKEFVLPSMQVQFNPRSTTNSISLQAGIYTDSDFGTISSKSYTWLGIQPSIPILSSSATYTGTSLSIQFVSIYGSEGENDEIQSFDIYQLSEPLEEGVDYTRVDELQVGSLLGTADIFIQENDTLATDSLFQFDISDDFGKLIFNKMVANDPIFENESTFNAFINGIAIVPSSNNNKILHFNTSTFRIKVNYTEVNSAGELVDRSYSLDIGSTNFYHIDSDLAGTPLNGMIPNNQDFEPSNDYRYLQAGTLIGLKVNLNTVYDYLNNEMASDTVSNIIIQKARFALGDISINKSGADYPFSLLGYFTDSENTWPTLALPHEDSLLNVLQGEIIGGNTPTFPGYYGVPQEILFGTIDSLGYDATMSNFFQNIIDGGYNTSETPLEQGGEMILFVPSSVKTPQSAPSHSQTNFLKVHKDSIRVKIDYSTTNF